jgi:hypothetical protein
VARSAKRLWAAAFALAAPLPLGACATTQQRAARARASNAIQVAGQVHVTRLNPAVHVEWIEIVHGPGGGALAVHLRNLSAGPLVELPISVGITVAGGRRVYLNRGPGVGFFDTHVPAVGAHAALTWVLRTRSVVGRGRPFADVGFPSKPAITSTATLPRIAVWPLEVTDRQVRVAVRNWSRIPQERLQLYATAWRAGRLVAAGRVELPALKGGARAAVAVDMTGHVAGAGIALAAAPTIFD